MLRKVKMFSGVSLALSLIAIGYCIYNFNGAFSEQFRGVNNIAFYGSLGSPTVLAIIALILGVSAYSTVNVILAMSADTEDQKEGPVGQK